MGLRVSGFGFRIRNWGVGSVSLARMSSIDSSLSNPPLEGLGVGIGVEGVGLGV